MVGLAGAVLGRVYADDLLTWLVLGAAVGSVTVSVAARRLPSWLVAPLSVLGLAGYAALALRWSATHAELAGPLPAIAADAARNGIPRLLTAMIPVEPTPDTVVVPLVSAWLAGLAGAEVALRTGRILLGYLPPAALFVGALYVVGPNADPAIWQTVGLVAVAAVGMALADRSRPPAAGGSTDEVSPAVRAAIRLRTLAGAATGLTAVVGLVALLGPLVAARVGTTPVDPRRYVQPPQVDTLDENPLIRVSGWALEPGQELFTVRTTGRPTDGGPAPAAPGPSADASPDPDGGAGDG
ncbi:MAG TPA: transglutaminase domain-containing protein, partial [Micromonospora sp.]